MTSALTILQSAWQKRLTGRCSVLRQSFVEDPDTGAQIPTDPDDPWPVVASNVPVHIAPASRQASNTEEGARAVATASFTARFLIGQDIRNTDRIEEATPASGRVFRLIGRQDATDKATVVFGCEEIV